MLVTASAASVLDHESVAGERDLHPVFRVAEDEGLDEEAEREARVIQENQALSREHRGRREYKELNEAVNEAVFSLL